MMEKQPKYRQVAGQVVRMIREGVFRPGEAVPSVRTLSRQWNVSISTILKAYYQLEGQGILIPKPRSGFYVANRMQHPPPEPTVSQPEPDPSTVGMRELITMVFLKDAGNPDLVQMGAAHPDPELTATDRLNRIMASAARRMKNKAGMYLPPSGYGPLCRNIARHAVSAGCSLEPGDVLVTTGCGEAVYLCLKAVCRPGDTVAMESPICFDVFQYLENLGLKALEIPTHPRDGISIEALRFALEHHPIQACIVISNYNNPLGSCIPDARKKELVELLNSREIPLIENDIFGDMHHGEKRPVAAKAFDTKGLVLWCGSFSKTLSPGLRVGWTAPARFQATVEWLKFSACLASATLPQVAVADFMAQGEYTRHLKRIRTVYQKRLSGLRQDVVRYFPENIRVTDPDGGFLLWVELPGAVDALKLYKEALNQGIAITPGHLFSTGDQYRHFIRLNASTWSEKTGPTIRRLGQVVSKMATPNTA